MRLLLIALLCALSFPAYSLGFGTSNEDVVVRIRTGKKEYTYLKLSDFPIVYDTSEKEAHVGFHWAKRDRTGIYKAIFQPIKSFEFDTDEQFRKWIETISPKIKCLTINGLSDCD